GTRAQNTHGETVAAPCAEPEAVINNGIQAAPLEVVAQSWVAEADIDWMQYWESWNSAEWRAIPLPTYPFARDSYWIPQGEVST
ncbi:hypothetical protein, partial [Xenorhabdus bovienii]|uniref:hypothetical protein n=1 Tax=Xenorhabdus bovienii TaxID=40576 RepID=UPI0023B34758